MQLQPHHTRLKKRALCLLGLFAVGMLGMSLNGSAAHADTWEWDPAYGYHEEEWYDPSDWFDPNDGIDYENDYYGSYYDGYGYDTYDADYYTDDAYGHDYPYYGHDYYTSDWYDEEPDFDNWWY